ncbi:MAG: branched-chain amino acid aminotransferase [Flavobacteriales bacterium]|jgi:branched-chain amino acid aminotransferase|nr:branched-chain amino acid aminotransferase [Flavobacteriales bacterium]
MDIEFIKESKLSTCNYRDFPFGTCFADHMFVIEFENGEWNQGTVKPYGPLTIMPSMQALHYGQAFFEGMKAYRTNDNEVVLFRPEENAKRFNRTAKRLEMPELPVEKFMEGLTTLLDIDREWVPANEGSSLYIRPVMYASGEGVKAADSYKYTVIIMTCPVDAYYQKPVRLLTELHYSRAAEGGTGDVKAAGNYAGSFHPAKLAINKGFDQLMWTDSKEHKYVEEAGTMNIFFVIGEELVTPELSGSILPGITRDSIIILAKSLGIKVSERQISLEELKEASASGLLKEAFGAGTAATISNIAEIDIEGALIKTDIDKHVSDQLKLELDAIRSQDKADPFGWLVQVERKMVN